MSDYLNINASDEELEAILKEARGERAADPVDDEPSKNWSMDDIDRLIANSNGEEYVPAEPKKDTVSEKFKRFFPDEFDEGMFSVQPIKKEEPEMQDISSGDEPEVDGQETFFEKEDDFDFNFDASVLPDDIPETPEIKYNNKTVQPEVLPPVIEKPAHAEKAEKPKADAEEKPETGDEEKPGTIDYRAMFFKKLKLEDIEEPAEEEPAGPVDISGIVVRKSEAEGEEDLDPLPQVMAAEDYKMIDEEKTKIVPLHPGEVKQENESDDVEGQIVLNGFVDIPEESIPSKEKESEVEQNLSARRKQKAKVFRLDDFEEDFGDGFEELDEDVPEEDTEEEKITEEEIKGSSFVEAVGEYTDASEKNRILAKLKELVNKKQKNMMIIGILNAVLLLLAFVPPVSELLSIESAIFSRDSMILCVVNALLIIGAAALNSEKIFSSFSALFKGRINGDTIVSVAVILALVENAISAITGADAPVFGAVAVFGIFVDKVTEFIDARRVLSNFSVCAFNYDHNMYAVHPFDNESEVFELGRGLLMGNAEMLYSSNVDFPDELIANSEKNSSREFNLKIITIAVAVASLAVGIICGISWKDFMTGLSAFTGAFCISAPIFGRFVPSFITYITDGRLNHEGTVITGLEAAEKASASNAVVLDSADIFDRNACTMHGMKHFESMRIDVVLLYAAAMVIKSGGPLKECFERVVDGRQDLLPPVRELVYEDKMGISARIYEQKVLLGNRNMLTHHNIKAPEKAYEDKYTHDGRKVIYLACNEQLAAMFIVSYRVDNSIRDYLRQLENNGIQVLVRTNDVNVTEELISAKFGLKQENFKILSSVAGRLYKRRKDAVSDRLSAEIIHDGKASSMLRAIAASCSMTSMAKIGGFIQIALMVISAVLAGVIGCTASFGFTAAYAALVMIAETAGLVGILTLGKKS